MAAALAGGQSSSVAAAARLVAQDADYVPLKFDNRSQAGAALGRHLQGRPGVLDTFIGVEGVLDDRGLLRLRAVRRGEDVEVFGAFTYRANSTASLHLAARD